MNPVLIGDPKNGRMADSEFLASLPRKVSSGGCVFRDGAGRVLVVKPTYKAGWELPGGVSELGESPRETARREVLEELGLAVRPGRLLCVDHVPPDASGLEGLHFLFDGGVLDDGAVSSIRLPEAELSEFRFVPLEVACSLVVPRLAPRLASAARSLEVGAPLYLERGLVVGEDG